MTGHETSTRSPAAASALSEHEVRKAREAMRAGGYQPIEVRTGLKAPLRRSWQTTRGPIPYHSFAANTGLLVEDDIAAGDRGIAPADHDIDDLGLALRVAAIVERHAGVSPVHRGRTGSNKFTTCYATTRPHRKLTVSFPSWPLNADGTVAKLEWLGSNNQVVVPPSQLRPTKHQPFWSSYFWRDVGLGRGPGLIEKRHLPLLDEAMVRALVEELCTALGGVLTVGSLDEGHATPATTIEPPSEQDAVDAAAALDALPCDYGSHERFIKIARAIHVSGVPFETFLAWCRSHPKFRESTSERWLATQWRSFRLTNRTTAATLFREVIERRPGWRKPSAGGARDQSHLPILPSPLDEPLEILIEVDDATFAFIEADLADAERAAAVIAAFLDRRRRGEVAKTAPCKAIRTAESKHLRALRRAFR